MADIIDLIYEDHDWFRRWFFYLDSARTAEELRAIWEPLATRLDTHAEAEETIFYPALLKRGEAGDPEDETEDAIHDHNAIRDAIRDGRRTTRSAATRGSPRSARPAPRTASISTRRNARRCRTSSRARRPSCGTNSR